MTTAEELTSESAGDGPDGGGRAKAAAGPPAAGLFRQRDFRMMWTGYAASAVGSEVTLLALPLAAAVLLGASPLQMGLLTAAGTLPYLGIGLVVGVLVDRMPRRRPLLIASDLVAAAI